MTYNSLLICADEEITSGTVTATINIGPFPSQEKFDLCKILSEADISCPIKKGPLNISISQKIPSFTPSVSAIMSDLSVLILL